MKKTLIRDLPPDMLELFQPHCFMIMAPRDSLAVQGIDQWMVDNAIPHFLVDWHESPTEHYTFLRVVFSSDVHTFRSAFADVWHKD